MILKLLYLSMPLHKLFNINNLTATPHKRGTDSSRPIFRIKAGAPYDGVDEADKSGRGAVKGGQLRGDLGWAKTVGDGRVAGLPWSRFDAGSRETEGAADKS